MSEKVTPVPLFHQTLTPVDPADEKMVADLSRLETRIIETALKVYRLVYPEPAHTPRATKVYYYNGKRDSEFWIIARIYLFRSPDTKKRGDSFQVEVRILRVDPLVGYTGIVIEQRCDYAAQVRWVDYGSPEIDGRPLFVGSAIIRL